MVKRLSEPHPGAPATKVAQVLPVSTLRKLQVLAWRLERNNPTPTSKKARS